MAKIAKSDFNHPQWYIQVTKNSNIIFFNFHFAHLVLPLALGALQPEDQLLGGLGLLPQDRLGLTSESLLLAVISDILTSHDLLVIRFISDSPPPSLSLLGLG